MALFAGNAVLDGGSDVLRTRAATANRVQYHVLRAYTFGDNYATALGNSVGSTACTAADFVQSTEAGTLARITTVASKSVTLTAGTGASPNVHVAVLDATTSEVLLVNDESNNAVMVAGGGATGPAFPYKAAQPTVAP